MFEMNICELCISRKTTTQNFMYLSSYVFSPDASTISNISLASWKSLLKPWNLKAEKPVDLYGIVIQTQQRNGLKECFVLQNPAIDFVKYTHIRSLHFIWNTHFSNKVKLY